MIREDAFIHNIIMIDYDYRKSYTGNKGTYTSAHVHLCAKLKFINLKKMHKFMGNLDIHFFFISILSIIWS